MGQYLFEQLAIVRRGTLKVASGVMEELADRIPDGFRNSIRWNLGHVYVVLERFAFQYIGLPLHLPDGFKERYEYGTSPLTCEVSAPAPTMAELEKLLGEQAGRIQEALRDRLQEKVTPYTTSIGAKLESPEQFLSLALFHEGLHLSVIKIYKSMLNR